MALWLSPCSKDKKISLGIWQFPKNKMKNIFLFSIFSTLFWRRSAEHSQSEQTSRRTVSLHSLKRSPTHGQQKGHPKRTLWVLCPWLFYCFFPKKNKRSLEPRRKGRNFFSHQRRNMLNLFMNVQMYLLVIIISCFIWGGDLVLGKILFNLFLFRYTTFPIVISNLSPIII